MPITSLHPTYEEFFPQWTRARDAFAGQDAIKKKSRREIYLPRLEGQRDDFEDDYEGYITRALWTGYSDRTLDGLVGAVFRKDPIIEFPIQWQDWVDDVTQTGQSLIDFSRTVFREAISINWGGILVDQPAAGEASLENRRPALRFYMAEDIRNWRIERVQGVPTVTQIILHEVFDEPAEDGFGMESDEQFRELLLIPTERQVTPELIETTLTYTQQLYRKQKRADGREEWLPFGPRIIPERRGQNLDFIPFFPVSADGIEFQIQISHMLDLVDVNYDHYRLDADHKHGLHFTALPTAWIAGFPIDESYRIGSQAAWVTDNPQASADFLEFSGAGLAAIVAEKEADEKRMAILGARLLEQQKRAVEAADTIRLRQTGEESILKTAARAVSSSLSNALWTMAWWGGQDNPEVDIRLNTDLMANTIDAQMITTLLAALQAGQISQQTFLENLVSGEIIQGREWQEEQELLEATTLPEFTIPPRFNGTQVE